MLYFSKLKLVSIYFIILFLSLSSLTNFFDNEDNYILSKKVNLGLDLQGGSYLLLEVDSQPVVKEKLQNGERAYIAAGNAHASDIDAFGKQAEVVAKYMSKGRPILIEGRLHLDSWESKTGEKRNKLKVILESFQFVGNRSDTGDTGYENVSPPSRKSDSSTTGTSHKNMDEQDIDDDVPF